MNLPASWCLTTVGEICSSLQYGYTASARNDQVGPRFLRITDIQDGRVQWASVPFCEIETGQIGKYSLNDGDIVFARTGGTVGKSYIIDKVPETSVFASYLIRLSAARFVNPRFLYYFFQSASYWEQIGLKKGGLQGNVNATTLSSLSIPLCPIHEQQRIVSRIEELFSELDKGIESLTAARAQLRIYRESTLKRLFLGKACLTRQERASDDDNTEHLPVTWSWVRVKDISIVVTKGASPKWQGIRYVDDEKQTLFITSENVRDNYLDLSKPKYVEDSFNIAQKRSLLSAGDVLFNIVGASIGRAAVFKDAHKANINQAVAVIRFTNQDVANYVALYLNSALGRSKYMGKRVEVARANLSLKEVSDIQVPLPPLGSIRSVLEAIEGSQSVVENLATELERRVEDSVALRYSILKNAFSGRLVPQSSNDEPASVLLKRICAEHGSTSSSNVRTKTDGNTGEAA